MSEEKGPIQSVKIFLGATGPTGRSGSRFEPWTVLVCSDLGFSSTAPQRVVASSWDEFMASHPVHIAGTIEDCLSGSKGVLYGEYLLDSTAGFSRKRVAAGLSCLRGLTDTLEALRRRGAGESLPGHLSPDLPLEGVPSVLAQEIRYALDATGPGESGRYAHPSGASVDRILAAMDFGAPEGTPPHHDRAGHSIDAGDLARRIEHAIPRQVDAFMNAPFFTQRKASWRCLRDLVKAVGRREDLNVLLYSGDGDGILDDLDGIIDACGTDASPDLVVWDYSCGLTPADIGRMQVLAKCAEQRKFMVVTSLSREEPLAEDLRLCETLIPVFRQQRFLPLASLRQGTASRCLSVFAPDIDLLTEADGNTLAPVTARGCWWFVRRWADSVLADGGPFAGLGKTPGETPDSVFGDLTMRISPSIAEEAHIIGLSALVSSPAGGIGLPAAVTMFDAPENARQYTMFSVNHLINRTMKLAGVAHSRVMAMGGHEGIRDVIGRFLTEHLTRYGVISSAENVTISQQGDGRASVKVDSDVILSGYPAEFEFEIG